MQQWRSLSAVAISAAAMFCVSASDLTAETMESALARAYRDNPQLNAQRAQVRSQDENVPQALSGYRPRIGVTATVGEQYSDVLEVTPVTGQGNVVTHIFGPQTPATYGISAQQNLFNGMQTANRTRAAESQVQAGREGLRVMEQNILLTGATVYMDVLRDTGNLRIQKNYVESLRQVLEQTRKRFSRGDVTVTDVAQAQAQLAGAEAAVLAAEATLATSSARYLEIIGIVPQNLMPASPVEQHVPANLYAVTEIALAQNPNITAAMYGVDVSHLQVKIAEGALFPTLNLQGSLQQASQPAAGIQSEFTGAILGQLTIPIYQGGSEYALIRQSKENLGQQRLNLDLIRRQTRTSVSQAWAQLIATKGELQKAKEQVSAAEAALNGMLKEIRVGERTTLDLLIIEQNLVNARAALLNAQHDRVVASYAVMAAAGRLSAAELHLPTPVYDPVIHYQQVRDAWGGLRTPDGR
jgi:outer membrane protein